MLHAAVERVRLGLPPPVSGGRVKQMRIIRK
jgi:hypothetical protein